jgi:indolepyruvate ferredoxin oxidoreductase beta subunit
MEIVNIIICGLGGQGILFLTKILAQTALEKGFNVMGAETHGMAQRGGSVISHLRLGDVKSSMVKVGSAHYLFSLEENEGYRNLPFLAEGGRMYVNINSHHSPKEEVKAFIAKRDIIYRSVSAGAIALEMRAPFSSNLAILGYFSAFREGPFRESPVNHEALRTTIETISPDRFKEKNLKVFDAGFQKGIGEVGH